MQKNLALAVVFFLAFYPIFVKAEQTINWAKINWPPFTMIEKGDVKKGLLDELLAFYQQNMSKYSHTNKITNFNRVWSDIKKGKNICYPGAVKTLDRPNYSTYSLPIAIAPSNHIIMKRDTYQKSDLGKSIRLEQLINNNQLSSIIEQTRSYTAVLDKLIEQRPKDSKIHSDTISSRKLVKLLMNDRFDYLIEYPNVANYFTEANNYQASELVSITIEELGQYTTSYLACPNNAWGQKVINDFNSVLTKIHNSPQYLELMSNAALNETQKKEIQQKYLQLFNQAISA